MASRTTNARIAAVATTLAAGVLAAFTLRPSTSGTSSATVARQPSAEVRTQVIRRTVHIVRHERPPRPRASAGKGAARSATAAANVAGGLSAPRTRTSGASTVAPSSGPTGTPVRTRTSGTAAAGEASRSGSIAPVRTRTSGSSTAGSSGGGKAVHTRTSGGGDGGDNGGGHDD